MAQFSEVTTHTLGCPYRESDRVRRMGVCDGQQRYRCRDCDNAFRATGKSKSRRMYAELMGPASSRSTTL